MSTLKALIRRNTKLFFRDKGMFVTAMITPMILVNGVYTIIDSFTTSNNVVMTYISNAYAKAGGRELSSAMSWIYFMIVILIVAIIASILSAFVFYQRKSE